MQSISLTFTAAARGQSAPKAGFSIFWMMVFAIAILDDAERNEKERRKKRERAAASARAPKPPTGPRPF